MLKNNIEKLFLLFLFISIGVASFSQETEYKIDYLHDTIKTHKTVAILPFNISISYQGFPRNTNDFINTSQEVRLGDYLQSEMFTYLSQRNSNYSVTFQNINTTNTLLRKANLIFKEVLQDLVWNPV